MARAEMLAELEKKLAALIESQPKPAETGESPAPQDFRVPRKVSASAPRESEDEGWLTAYLDTMTLLLSFLVILIAQATFDDTGQPPTPEDLEQQEIVLDVPGAEVAPLEGGLTPLSQQALANSLQLAMDGAEVAGTVSLQPESGDIHMQIYGDASFLPGSAAMTERGAEFVAHVAMLVYTTQQRISVEGHTDDVPINSDRFPSNWHLSSARSNTVVNHLIDNGVRATRLRSIGWGDTRPTRENDTAAGRAENRRVTITIHRFAPF